MFNYENSQYTEQYGQYYNMIKIIENVDGLLICHWSSNKGVLDFGDLGQTFWFNMI
jgi:hypothetical protein